MAITAEQREKRKAFIGSSDIAAIVGADPFRNAGDLWLEKTGRLAPENSNGKHTKRGTRLEPLALDWFEERMSVTLARDIWLDDGDSFCANLDAATVVESALVMAQSGGDAWEWNGHRDLIQSAVEAKSTKWIELWGDSVDEVPLPVILQVQWQMLLIGKHSLRGYAPVLWPKYHDFGFEIPPSISRDDEMIEGLEFAAREFLDYVRTDKQPPDAPPHIEALKRVRREPDSVVSFDAEQSELSRAYWDSGMKCEECGWFGHKDKMKADLCPECGAFCSAQSKEHFAGKEKGAHTDYEHFRDMIIAMLGTAEAARLTDGSEFRWMQQNSQRRCDYDLLQHRLALLQDNITRAVDLLKTASPGEALAILQSLDAEALYRETVAQGQHRVLRLKAPKIGGKRK